MIESISVTGIVSADLNSEDNCADPSRVTFFHDLAERSKCCSSQVPSHLTGAPIGFDIRALRGKPSQLTVNFDLPVARSLVGQDLLHGWTEGLSSEKVLTSRLIRKILLEQELTHGEASSFFATAKAKSTNLVWHIDQSSPFAAQDLLARTARQVKVLNDHNDDDFYGILDYEYVNTSNEVSLNIVLSAGNSVRLSIQPAQLADFISHHVEDKTSVTDILATTEAKIRVTVTIGQQLLSKLDNGNPKGWSDTHLQSCIDQIWTRMGFMTQYVPYPAKLPVSGYPKGAKIILDRYLRDPEFQGLDQEYVTNVYDLLLKDGVDLKVRPEEHRFLDGSIGAKLHFSNRWQMPDEMHDLIVSPLTEPRLIMALSKSVNPPRQQIFENPLTSEGTAYFSGDWHLLERPELPSKA